MFMFLFEQFMVAQRQTMFKYHIESLKSLALSPALSLLNLALIQMPAYLLRFFEKLIF